MMASAFLYVYLNFVIGTEMIVYQMKFANVIKSVKKHAISAMKLMRGLKCKVAVVRLCPPT